MEPSARWQPVGLYGDEGPAWRGVSPSLVAARALVAGAVAVLALGAVVVLGLLAGGRWVLPGGAAAVLAGWFGTLWLVRRQVGAISWAEQGEELVIRRGRLWRSLVSVPYGRLQLVDVRSGPVLRHLGLARVELHTAAPRVGASIPGLPVAEAEALRQRLAERGESQRAGL